MGNDTIPDWKLVADSILESVSGRVFVSDVVEQDELVETATNSWEYTPSESITIDSQKENTELPTAFDKLIGTNTYSPGRVYEFENVILAGSQPIVFTDKGRIVLESVENSPKLLNNRVWEFVQQYGVKKTYQVFKKTNQVKSETIGSECIFPLVRHPTTNYFHWMMSYVPKIQAFKHCQDHYNPPISVLVEQSPPSWVTESLQLVGISAEDRIEWENNCKMAETVLLPTHYSSYERLEFKPSAIRWLREMFIETIQSNQGSPSAKRVFISRMDADARRCNNRTEIQAVLDSFGFETFTLTDLTVREQVTLFNNADIVVGPHGAGLTNIIFGNELSIVELFPDDKLQPMYFQLARQLEFDYQYCCCEQTGVDMIVDPDELAAAISRAINE